MSKKDQNRVLAYNMAKEITEEQMMEVAGGSAGSCMRPCVQPSALKLGLSDMILDVTVDF